MENKKRIYTYKQTTNKIVLDENNVIFKTSMLYKYPVGSTIEKEILDKYFKFLEFENC